MKKRFMYSVQALIVALVSVLAFPSYSPAGIPMASRKPPAPPKPGEEYSWVRKWCSFGWREYGLDHAMRCDRLTTGTGTSYVLSSYGCGTSCRLYNKQIEPPQRLANGWLRVHVFSSIWLGKFDFDTKTWSWANEGFRSGPASSKKFWFAQCDSGLFGSGRTSKLSETKVRSVYIESGKYKGLPKRTTVAAAIYDRWHRLCQFNGPLIN